jgi:hypothetical protein
MHFKKGAKIIKLNAALANLNVRWIYCATVGEIWTQKRTTWLVKYIIKINPVEPFRCGPPLTHTHTHTHTHTNSITKTTFICIQGDLKMYISIKIWWSIFFLYHKTSSFKQSKWESKYDVMNKMWCACKKQGIHTQFRFKNMRKCVSKDNIKIVEADLLRA